MADLLVEITKDIEDKLSCVGTCEATERDLVDFVSAQEVFSPLYYTALCSALERTDIDRLERFKAEYFRFAVETL